MAPKPSQAQQLVDAARLRAEFFRGSDEHSYARVLTELGSRTYRIRSGVFRKWLRYLFVQIVGRVPNAQALQDAINQLDADAEFSSGPVEDVHIRLGERDGNIYFDLGNSSGEAVEIRADGWTVKRDHGVNFRRPKGLASINYPRDEGSFDALRELGNLEDDNAFVLAISCMVGYLNPSGPFPVQNIVGEQGSSKTTLCRMVKRIVDSNTSPMRSCPRDERDLMIAANNGWLLAFDNVSKVHPWLSDALCRLSTGGGFSTRQLYSDDEETIFDAIRPIVTNGIGELISRQDLIDRTVTVTLPSIGASRRRTESSLWRAFQLAQPSIFGALLNAVSMALHRRDQISFTHLPRMADFTVWVAAAEEALPWKQGTFLREYERNRQEAIEVSLETDHVAAAIREYVQRHGGFEGTATELLSALTDQVDEKVQKQRSWPRTANALSGRVRRAAPFLRHDDIDALFDRESGTGRRLIVVSQIEAEKDRHNRHGDLFCDDRDDRDDEFPSQSADEVAV